MLPERAGDEAVELLQKMDAVPVSAASPVVAAGDGTTRCHRHAVSTS
jgi:hypothetical protein